MRNRVALALSLALLALALAGAYALASGAVRIPDRWNPWAPLDLEDPFNVLTRYKLYRLANNPALCRSALARSDLRYEPVPDRETGPGCGFRNAVRIERTTARTAEPFVLSCESAVALALWERHVLQPAAVARFGRPVARLDHFGSYSCRNVYGREGSRRSRHATADALDVAGFTLAGGKRIRVAADWNRGGPEAAFLRDVHKGACRVFDAALGPDYDEAHRDHFHLDRGSFRACR